MRRRTRISLAVIAVSVPIAALGLIWWSREANALANALFQGFGSIAVVTAFVGILFPACARWALRVGVTTDQAQRNPVIRFMAGLDDRDR